MDLERGMGVFEVGVDGEGEVVREEMLCVEDGGGMVEWAMGEVGGQG